MDKTPNTSNVLKHAQTYWQLLQGLKVDNNARRQARILASGNLAGNSTERIQSLLNHPQKFYAQQPGTPALIEKWKSRFEPTMRLSESEARQFVSETSVAMELLQGIFSDHCFSGVTSMSRNTPTDHVNYRPAGMLTGWSLNLTVRGIGHYNCIRQTIMAGTGQLVLLSPDALYDYQREAGSDNWTHQWVYFQPDVSILKWLNWQEVGPNIYHLKIPNGEIDTIKNLFDNTLKFNPLQDDISSALLMNIIEEIFIRCARFLSADNQQQLTDSRVDAAMEFISTNLTRALSVQDIADHVQLSKTQLSMLFKNTTGSSLVRWREERRIAKASELLTQSQLQIQEIAGLVGYEDPLYFSRSFSKLVGCSPKKYRLQRIPVR